MNEPTETTTRSGSEGSAGNLVTGNVILRNHPDVFWDETGDGNVFRYDLCRTSAPPALSSWGRPGRAPWRSEP